MITVLLSDIVPVTAKDCYFSCIATVAAYYKCLLPAGAWFFLLKGIDLPYEKQTDNKNYRMRARYTTKRCASKKEYNCKQFSVSTYPYSESASQDSIEHIFESNIPVILCCDVKAFTHDAVFQNSKTFTHYIVAFRKDGVADELLFWDPYIMHSERDIGTYQGELRYSDIEKSIKEIIQFRITEPVGSDSVLYSIVESLDCFCGNVSITRPIVNDIRNYIKDIIELTELEDKFFCEQCLYAAYNISNMNNVLMIDYLTNTLKIDTVFTYNNASIVESLHSAATKWKNIRLQLQKAGITKNRQVIGDIVDNCLRQLLEQHNILLKLRELLSAYLSNNK